MIKISMYPPNNRMQSDFGKRYALTSAADAKRYVDEWHLENDGFMK